LLPLKRLYTFGAFSQKRGINFPRTVVKRIPQKRFLEPGYFPLSNTTVSIPALAKVIAAAMPAGPAPMTITSNFASSAILFPPLNYFNFS